MLFRRVIRPDLISLRGALPSLAIMPSAPHPLSSSHPPRFLPRPVAALLALLAFAPLLARLPPPPIPPPLPLAPPHPAAPLAAIAAAAHPRAGVAVAGEQGGIGRRLQGLRARSDVRRKWNGGSFLEFSADESARVNGLGGGGGMVWRAGWWGRGAGSDERQSGGMGTRDGGAGGDGVAESARAHAVTERGGRGADELPRREGGESSGRSVRVGSTGGNSTSSARAHAGQQAAPHGHAQWRVRRVALHPAVRRDTGLPLRCDEWRSNAVLLISAAAPGLGLSPLLRELDARLQSVGLAYTLALMPRSVTLAHAHRYAPLYRAAPLGGSAAVGLRAWVRYSVAHAEVWARVVALRLPFALVLEEDAVNRAEGVADWQRRLETLLWELNLLILQRADRFFFHVLLLARHALAPYAEQQLSPGIVRAQPSEASHAYLVSYAGAKRLLALTRFNRPLSESMGAIPALTVLAAEPPLFATTIFACSPKPCRTPPPALSLPASTPLTPACRATILLALPGHPALTGAALHATWPLHRPAPHGPLPSIPRSSPAFCALLSPAQCLLKHHLPHLLPHVHPPPPAVLLPALPPSLPLWPAFLLSLRRSPRRLQRVLPLLQQQGFGDVVVAHGVDGGKGEGGGGGDEGREGALERNLEVFGRLVDGGHASVTRRSIKWHKLAERRREKMTRGEVACALSHYLLWLEVLRRQLPYAIILEDDVTFTTDTFRADFERNIAEANELLTRQHSPESPPDILFVGHMGVVPRHFLPLLAPHIALDALSWCSFAYIISQRGAAQLVRGFHVDDPLDSLWWRHPRLAFWAFQPPLAFHLSSPRLNSPRLNSSLPHPPSSPSPAPPSHPPHPTSTHSIAGSTAHSKRDSSSSSSSSSSNSHGAGRRGRGEDTPLPEPVYLSEVQQGGDQWR
ncbi:hypothetical protein CLOP_g12617 [Closterium sp. NIES-67]|nr:hypothetical protein CLOP_g12617 [Closterium sp. NIES-67]